MKQLRQLFFFVLIIFTINSMDVLAQKDSEIISLYKGSNLVFDDNIGFETHYYLTGPTSHKAVDGKMRRQFCELPEDISTPHPQVFRRTLVGQKTKVNRSIEVYAKFLTLLAENKINEQDI